mgnify:CR=1 FL=1
MRKSMKKLIALTLACLLLATLFVGCGKKDDGGSSGGDTIKLGWMGSLTGDQAAYGTCESQTLKMLVEDLNANGGLLGKQVELICYDTKGDAQEAVNVAKRLCAQDQVCAIIGPNASGQCIAIQSVLDQYKISDMSTVATNEKVTMQDGQLKEYNFRVCFLDPQQGKIAGSFVYDNLGFDKAAILYDVNDDYALGLKDNFVKVFESKGGTIVAEEGYTAGDTDFTAQLTKIKEAQPQIIFTPIFAPVVQAVGIDLMHFAIIFVLNAEIGFLTPPLGTNLFVAMDQAKCSLGEISKAVIPFILFLFLMMAILIILPQISLWLPQTFLSV